MFVQITSEIRKYIILFFEAQSTRRTLQGRIYARFKQVKPWPLHVEVSPGVKVVVTNKELCHTHVLG